MQPSPAPVPLELIGAYKQIDGAENVVRHVHMGRPDPRSQQECGRPNSVRDLDMELARTRAVKVSLRSLLLLCLAVALFLRYAVIPIQRQKEARLWVESQRGHYVYDAPYRPNEAWPIRTAGIPVPERAVDWLGIDTFATVTSVHLDCEEIYDLDPIAGLSGLEELHIIQFVHPEVDFSVLRSLPDLRKLYLTEWSGVDMQDVKRISAQLPNVEIIAEAVPWNPR